MSKIELLRKCRRELREMAFIEDQLYALETSLLPRAIQYKDDNVQLSPEDYHTKTMQKIIAMKTMIGKKLCEMTAHQAEAMRLIFTLQDSNQRQVLTLYYLTMNEMQRGSHTVLRLHTWKSVAEVMGYSEQHARRLAEKGEKKIKMY